MRRKREPGGPPLEPMPKWGSLKEGDAVMGMGAFAAPCVLVRVHRSKRRLASGRAVYPKRGLMLDLGSGEAFEVSLDDLGVRGEVVRAPRG